MIVYKYLPAGFALQALQMRRIKICRVDTVNDIYDCRPKIIGEGKFFDDSQENAENYFLKKMNQEVGIISYCAEAESLLVWSHYGDSHKGIALGFEFNAGVFLQGIPFDVVRQFYPVRYPPEITHNKRTIINASKIATEAKDHQRNPVLDMLIEGFLDKGFEWEYEKEHREFIHLSYCDIQNDLYFMPFECRHLKEVIIGARCDIDASMIEHSFWNRKSSRSDLIIKKAQPNPDEYRMETPEIARLEVKRGT